MKIRYKISTIQRDNDQENSYAVRFLVRIYVRRTVLFYTNAYAIVHLKPHGHEGNFFLKKYTTNNFFNCYSSCTEIIK